MLKLSACLIVRNEAKNIRKCLESLAGFDEIVVLDTGSIDDTPAICRHFKRVKVFYDVWSDDFSAARNKAIGYCTGNWILSIDADEVLGSFKELQEIVDINRGKRTIAVQIETDREIFNAIRLFQRSSQIHFVGRVHETINVPAEMFSPITIRHYPGERDPQRNIRILREVLAKEKYSTREMFYLGVELMALDNYEGGLYWLDYYTTSAPKDEAFTAEAYFMQAQCYLKLGRVPYAIEKLLKAVQTNLEHKASYDLLYRLTKEPKWKMMRDRASNRNALRCLKSE